MNIATIILLATLLCAECPACSIEERWLIAQTVVYRSSVAGLPIDTIIYQPGQYPGTTLIDLPAYLRVRRKELAENLQLASAAIFIGPTIKVSNFARTGTGCYGEPCWWESTCEIVSQQGTHTFYACPEWERRQREQDIEQRRVLTIMQLKED